LTPSTVVVIPLGAGSKEHGPHLPLATDLIQAEYFRDELAKLDSVVIAPAITYSYYPPFLSYAGSTSLRLLTARDMLVEVVRSLAGYGPKRFYIINEGITTLVALESAAKILREDGIVLGFSDDTRPSYEKAEKLIKIQATGSHADEMETSLMLFIRPEIVNMNKAVDDTNAKVRSGPILSPVKKVNTSYAPSGVYGYATLATKEKGERGAAAELRQMMIDIDSIRLCVLPSQPDHTSEYAGYTGSYTFGNGKKLIISVVDNRLQYIIDGRSMVGIYPLSFYDNDHFCSQLLDMLFVRNDKNEVEKAWCNLFSGPFWATKEKY
jgi:creatinine amidohydrolase